MKTNEEPGSYVRVSSARGQRCLIATGSIAPGARLFLIEGRESDRPSRYSVQVGADLHIQVEDDALVDEERFDPKAWRFMNHSCDPNAVVRGREFVAYRDISEGDAVTFDYDTSEYDMAEPFSCHCAAPRCRGMIRGFRHLDAAGQAALRPLLSAHLRSVAASHRDPLHGVTLEQIVSALLARYGWEELGNLIRIRCFTENPSVSSSLKFLRKTAWARAKVEELYVWMQQENAT